MLDRGSRHVGPGLFDIFTGDIMGMGRENMEKERTGRFCAAAFRIAAVFLCTFIAMVTALSATYAESTATTDTGAETGETAEATANASDAALAQAAPKIVVNAPGKVKSVKVTSPKISKAVVSWKKLDCKGIVVSYSRYKSMKSAKSIKLKGTKTKVTIKGLTSGKRYYFKVRAYNKKKKIVKYGEWSERKSVVIHVHKYVKQKSCPIKLTTGTPIMYKCSCGAAYYHTKGNDGRMYDGLVYKLPSCVEGVIRKTPKSDSKALACTEAHKAVEVKEGVFKCKECGQKLNHFVSEYVDENGERQSNIVFAAPKNTNLLTCVAASVKNKDGEKYKYKLYYQKSKKLKYKYEKYRKYMDMHGCSTCALTTILNATVPKYKDYTPDQVLVDVIRPSVGAKAYNKNFSKSLKKQMPIGLKGINKVLKDSGVRCKYVYNYTKKSAAKEIRAHLEQGNPIIFMQPKSTHTPNTHAMLMLGLDEGGRVIVGDSVLRSASKWGKNNRLIKYNTRKSLKSSTVENICKYFNASTTSVKGRGYFYDGRKGNIGYILVYKD